MGNTSLRQWWKVFRIIRTAFKGMSRKEVTSIFERGFLQDRIATVIREEYKHIKESSPLFLCNREIIPPRDKPCFKDCLTQGVIEATPSFNRLFNGYETEAMSAVERCFMAGFLKYRVHDSEICKVLARLYSQSRLVVTLEDIAHMVLESPDILTKDGHWNIFYVRVTGLPRQYYVAVGIGYSKRISNSWVITAGKLDTIDWREGDKVVFPDD